MINIPKDGWILAGTFGVDAGLCWIGDPCYVLPDDATYNPGSDWGIFCENIDDDSGITNFSEGMAISTGYGDGQYPVYVRKVDGRPMQIFIDFDYYESDEDDDDSDDDF